MPVVFARNNSLRSLAIRYWTKEAHGDGELYSHVGVIFRGFVLESKGASTCQATRWEDFISRYTKYEVRYLPVLNENKALAFYNTHVLANTPHDGRRAIGFILDKLGLAEVITFNNQNHLDCAEFVAAGAGWIPFTNKVTPNYLRLFTVGKQPTALPSQN